MPTPSRDLTNPTLGRIEEPLKLRLGYEVAVEDLEIFIIAGFIPEQVGIDEILLHVMLVEDFT